MSAVSYHEAGELVVQVVQRPTSETLPVVVVGLVVVAWRDTHCVWPLGVVVVAT